MNIETVLIFVPVSALLALGYAAILIMRVLSASRGDEKIIEVQRAIAQGANAYIRRQYTVVAMFFAAAFVLLLLLVRAGYLPWPVPFAF